MHYDLWASCLYKLYIVEIKNYAFFYLLPSHASYNTQYHNLSYHMFEKYYAFTLLNNTVFLFLFLF